MQLRYFVTCACLWFSSCGLEAVGQTAGAEQTPPTAKDEADITAAIQSYVTAFNAHDVDKLLAHWTGEGVYTSRSSGERVVGRDAMAAEFESVFAGDDAPKLAVATESIEFISPNVALERGTATVTRGNDDPEQSRYSVVYVKREGSWLIDRVTEEEIVKELSHYENLKDLEWMIGEWTDAGEDFAIEIDCQWTRNQNFIARKYAVTDPGGVASSGLQIIGWDAKTKEIRSWLFDSDGSVVTGTWTKRENKWVVESVATLADGASGSFTSIFRPLEDGTYAWMKVNQVVDGQLLPNLDEIVVQRK